MDAETRHHLKQNELAQALGKLRSLDTSTVLTLLAVLAVIVFIIGYRAYSSYAAGQTATEWSEMFALNPLAPETGRADLEQLRQIAQERSDRLGAVAGMRAASMMLYDALEGSENAADKVSEARQLVSPIVENSADYPSAIAGPAHFLAARLCETQRDFAAAREHYNTLLTERFAGNPLQRRAEANLETLDELQEPVELVAGAPPAPPTPAASPPPMVGPPTETPDTAPGNAAENAEAPTTDETPADSATAEDDAATAEDTGQ
jgi:hypothetical protein